MYAILVVVVLEVMDRITILFCGCDEMFQSISCLNFYELVHLQVANQNKNKNSNVCVGLMKVNTLTNIDVYSGRLLAASYDYILEKLAILKFGYLTRSIKNARNKATGLEKSN